MLRLVNDRIRIEVIEYVVIDDIYSYHHHQVFLEKSIKSISYWIYDYLLVINVVKIVDKLTLDEHWRRLRINKDNQLFCIRIICICGLKKRNQINNSNKWRLNKHTLMFENKNYF